MAKFLTVILVAAVAAVFAMDNLHHVPLGLVLGTPVNVRLFFLLLTSFLLGCFSTMFVSLYRKTKSRNGDEGKPDTNDDEFFSD